METSAKTRHLSSTQTSAQETRPEPSVDGKTVPEAYLNRIDLTPQQRLYLIKRNGKYETITWADAHVKVLGAFAGLTKAGVGPGDTVAIASQSRPEWTIADIAIQSRGAATVPIYHSSTIEDIAFILQNSEAKLVFVEDEPMKRKLQDAMKVTGNTLPLVSFNDATWTDFTSGADAETQKRMHESVAAIRADAPASIVYTSGTTGRPKGAVLTHANFMSELRGVVEAVKFNSSDLTVTFLPFAHVLGRLESLAPIVCGISLGFAESINSVSLNITELKPTLLVSVPRIYEKIYAKIQSEVESQPEFKRNLFKWAVNVGRAAARLRSLNEPLPLPLHLKFRVADTLVFQKIRAKLGGNIRLTVSGGAPLNPELCELFHACGIKVLEGYGLTETTAAVVCNRPDSYGFGTVGKPFPGMEVRIAADGEIQLKGPMVFKGYHRNEEATAEVFTPDGWFCTGDIGEITPRGFLRITDRKKELIVTSGGKNIAPQKLENMLKGSRFVSNGLVYGDKQKYLVALITLNEGEMKGWARSQGLGTSLPELATSDKVRALIDAEIRQVNAQLASYESIKRFSILPQDFTVESGELTPSLKLKRKVLVAKYREVIFSLYS